MFRTRYPLCRAFTLIELLVVVSIISLLVSMLLPSLHSAMRIARTAKCACNEHDIGMGMQFYAREYNDAIVGNAWTSGAFLKTKNSPAYNDFYCPGVCQTWDWTAPIATEMGIGFDRGPTVASRTSRFVSFNNYKGFMCPENNIKAAAYAGSPITVTTTMLSYNTALMFQYVYGQGDLSMRQSFIDTGDYTPVLSRIGIPSDKIFLSDGARWTDSDNAAPDYNLSWDGGGSPGGAYSDYGPWSQYSRSFLRNTPMAYSMRHGNRSPGGALEGSKFNALFFDGHVATLSGKEGMNPRLWLPKDSVLPSTELSTEANTLFMAPESSMTIP